MIKRLRQMALFAIAAASLAGCNMVISDHPIFAAADGLGAPPIRTGVWVSDKPA